MTPLTEQLPQERSGQVTGFPPGETSMNESRPEKSILASNAAGAEAVEAQLPLLESARGSVLTPSGFAMDVGLDPDPWTNDLASENSYWPFMPFLSQLESLPEDFDLSSLQ